MCGWFRTKEICQFSIDEHWIIEFRCPYSFVFSFFLLQWKVINIINYWKFELNETLYRAQAHKCLIGIPMKHQTVQTNIPAGHASSRKSSIRTGKHLAIIDTSCHWLIICIVFDALHTMTLAIIQQPIDIAHNYIIHTARVDEALLAPKVHRYTRTHHTVNGCFVERQTLLCHRSHNRS